MASKQSNTLHVEYCLGDAIVPMGKLAYQNRTIFFEYAPSFLELKLELSPFKLPLKSGVITCTDRVFEGLFGVFNDSLPDGWGRLLLDRKLTKLGINPDSLTPLDRLKYVGRRGMGALFYVPEISDSPSHKLEEDLDILAEECIQFQDEDDDQFVDDLLLMNGSSAGARPKILVTLRKDKNKFEITDNNFSKDHDDWIIKFRSSIDPKDSGPIEYAYHLMALEGGLKVPEARLFNSKKCIGYFGVKRFDREQSKFLHMHTLSGLLHVDHRIPSLDYNTLMKATLWLTKDVRECEKQFRYAVFNVFSHNRDDHAKNFSFLMDEKGNWKVSPAYDLIFSTGPAGEHCTMIMGEGKNPGISHLLKLAEIASIDSKKALEIIDQVRGAVNQWKDFARIAKVTSTSTHRIQLALDSIDKLS
jgi:serine/threonine-protein kinase HipA